MRSSSVRSTDRAPFGRPNGALHCRDASWHAGCSSRSRRLCLGVLWVRAKALVTAYVSRIRDGGGRNMAGLGDKVEGKAKELKGKLTGDKATEMEGKGQQAAGELKDTVDDVADEMRDRSRDRTRR